MKFIDWQLKATGVPFVEHGRDFDGWDCYGAIMSAYREVAKISIPDYSEYAIKDFRRLRELFEARSAGFWRQVDGPGPMVAACLFRRGLSIHTGICVSKREIMHVEQGIETCIEPLSAFRIEGFYVPASCGTASV